MEIEEVHHVRCAMNNKINNGKHGRKGTWHLANGGINDAIEEK